MLAAEFQLRAETAEFQLGAEEEETDKPNCHASLDTLMNTPDDFGQILGGLVEQLKHLGDEAAKLERTWRQRRQQWCGGPANGVGTAERISRAAAAKQPFKRAHASQVPFAHSQLKAATSCISNSESMPISEPKAIPEGKISLTGSVSSLSSSYADLEQKYRDDRTSLKTQFSTKHSTSSLRKQTLSALFLMRGIWCELDEEFVNEYVERYNLRFSIPNRDSLLSINKMQTEKELRNTDDEQVRYHHCILHPSSLPKLSWTLCCLFLIAYDIIFIPLEAFNLEEHIFMFITEWICTIAWTLDILVSLRTAVYKGDALVTDPWQIAKSYARTWLCLDMIIVLLEWASRVSSFVPSGSSLLRTTRILRMLRCARLLRLAKVQVLWGVVEEQMTSSIVHLLVGIAKWTFLLCMFVHLVSCLWYTVGASKKDGWTAYEFDSSGLERHKLFIFWYVASCRWTLAQINGRTDTDPRRNTIEILYTCLIAVVFAIIFMALFISSITATMMELNELAESRTQKRRLVDSFLRKHRVSLELIGNIRHHVGIDEGNSEEQGLQTKVLAILPDSIAQDLLYEVQKPILTSHKWFDGINCELPRALRHLCKTVVCQIYPKFDEIMFDRGDACTKMFFMFNGHTLYVTNYDPSQDTYVDEEQRDDPIEVILGRSRWLCEPALWMEWVNRGRLVSQLNCSMLTMEAVDFARQLREYRNAYAFAVMYGRAFLKALQSKGVLSDLTQDMTAT